MRKRKKLAEKESLGQKGKEVRAGIGPSLLTLISWGLAGTVMFPSFSIVKCRKVVLREAKQQNVNRKIVKKQGPTKGAAPAGTHTRIVVTGVGFPLASAEAACTGVCTGDSECRFCV